MAEVNCSYSNYAYSCHPCDNTPYGTLQGYTFEPEWSVRARCGGAARVSNGDMPIGAMPNKKIARIRRRRNPRRRIAQERYLNSSGANVMLCHGQYVVNDPCYPMCSRQDGNGCEQPWGGNQSGGPTQQYSITQGDGRGDSFTRHVVTPIDPYQSITPEDLGGSSSFRGYNSSGPGGTGDTIIKVGGDTYSYDPVLSYDMGCNIMDEMGDGIEPYKNCDDRGNSGIPGMNVSSLRYKNGVLV